MYNILRQKKYYWFKFINLGKYLGGSSPPPSRWMKPWYEITTRIPSVSEYEILADFDYMVEKRGYQTTKFISWPNLWLCGIILFNVIPYFT